MSTDGGNGKTAVPSQWPRAAASFALLRGDEVLLVKRGKAPRADTWSLPGGHIEPGERAAAAAERELLEETGLEATAIALVDVLDVIVHDKSGTLSAHYVLSVYCGRWQTGEPCAMSDAADARFVAPDHLDEYPLTPGANRIISLARQRLAGD